MWLTNYSEHNRCAERTTAQPEATGKQSQCKANCQIRQRPRATHTVTQADHDSSTTTMFSIRSTPLMYIHHPNSLGNSTGSGDMQTREKSATEIYKLFLVDNRGGHLSQSITQQRIDNKTQACLDAHMHIHHRQITENMRICTLATQPSYET